MRVLLADMERHTPIIHVDEAALRAPRLLHPQVLPVPGGGVCADAATGPGVLAVGDEEVPNGIASGGHADAAERTDVRGRLQPAFDHAGQGLDQVTLQQVQAQGGLVGEDGRGGLVASYAQPAR